ncbi:MFS transporter [Paenibacillus spiritus]|uniref:MFS transporter n=1 Tax=Paenibacillus spiritus TaxID=2496557 RepID=A0A5J5G9L9_9BACL|nr:MFS transporter [Paenibacillus spiritus]KAA9004728.1 MFS transporter [Paenibacillus spiritus]
MFKREPEANEERKEQQEQQEQQGQEARAPLTRGLMLLLAAACGLIVANLYYSQTLAGPIGEATGLSPQATGLIVTLTQVGYVLGLLFVVPLSDLAENRRLAVISLAVLVAALAAAMLADSAALFLAASLVIGIGAVVAQILVPYAAFLSSEEQRGQAVGNVMSGLLLGIMLARPAASFIAGFWNWHAVFGLSAVLMVVLAALLARVLPKRRPEPALTYGGLLLSLGGLLRHTPVLRRRALYQASLFGVFSLFWTTVPLYLADRFQLSQQGIAWFALAGVGGAAAAPVAGRLADRGLTRPLTAAALGTAAASFAAAHWIRGDSVLSLIGLALIAIVLDMAVSGNLVLGQRAIYALGSETRGRLNGLFMAIFFIGGAAGSSIGGWAYATGGWELATLIGAVPPLLALAYSLTDRSRT